MRNSVLAGVAAGAFLISAAGTAMVLPKGADAADPTPTPAAATATPTATTMPTIKPATPGATSAPSVTNPTTGQDGDLGGNRGRGMGPDDVTAAAKALGMTEAELTTQLQGGKSVADVAKAESVDLQKVIDAIVASDTAEIEAAVKAGTMTQAQADARLANLTQHVTDEVNGTGFGGGHGGHGGPGGLDADDLTAAAKALGMTEADLTTELQSGKTAAQVATDKKVDVQKVIDAIVASDTAEIEAAVKAGTMTQAQADARLANLTQHVTDEVNGTGLMGGRGGHHGGFDGDGDGGDGQQPAASPATGA